MSLNVLSLFNFKSASWPQDWTPQELAEFYRVEASLVRANIPIETDRGRSDEGDPWFVFSNASTGEIIVHFARFDGTYVVASPALDNCARGPDFRALIEAQITSHPLVVPSAASGGKLFIHPAALLIVLVATCFFKLSQTTAAAGELHKAQPAHPGVGSLSHSGSEPQAVMLDKRAAATLLAAIVTGIAWAQSNDFNFCSIGATLPPKIDVPAQDLSLSTSSAVASPFDVDRDSLFQAHSPAAALATPLTVIGGDPSTTSPGYRTFNDPNNHTIASETFTRFESSTPDATQSLPAASGLLSSAESAAVLIKSMPIAGSTVSGSTVSSGLPTTAPSTPTAGPSQYVALLNSDAQTSAHIQASLENYPFNLAPPSTNIPTNIPTSPYYHASVADFVLREFQAAWGVVPTSTEYDAWVARIMADPTLENGGMSQALAGTTQFQTLYGVTGATVATAATVTALCEGVLGIPPGPGAMLNVGLPAWQVLQNLAQSSQFIAETSSRIVGFQNALFAGATPTGSIFNIGGATTTDIQHPPTTNELAGVSLTGPFNFVVNELAVSGSFDFALASGATNVESLNSTGNVKFINLAAGTNAEIGGSATPAGTVVYVTYASPTTAKSFQINGGVNGVSFKTPATSTDAPTSETILSTGGANGTVAHPDWLHITNSAGSATSLTVNATTSLVAGLWDLDFNAAAGATTLTVSGPAALVDLTQDFTDPPFSIVSASGLTAGGLHLNASNDLTMFTGGSGGGNELLYNGQTLNVHASTIDGGGGMGNILASELVNPNLNGSIFSNWQILDITQYQDVTGFTTFDASLLSNDVIKDVQLTGADLDVETVLNIAPAATAMVTGTGFTDAGLTLTHSSATGDNLAVMFNNTDNASSLNDLLLTNLTSTGDAAVSIDSTGASGSTPSVGYNGIATLAETNGILTRVIVTSDNYFYLGYSGGVSTDHATTSTADITSALHTINASATTGGVSIYAGNTTRDFSGFDVSYKGLTLDGGSGANDILYNGANGGVVADGNGRADAVWLGGSNASGTLGTGASDVAVVGNSAYATAVTPIGPEAPGSALGNSVTFGAGATADIIIGGGAEWDGLTVNANNGGVGQTTVFGAVAAGGTTPGTLIDLSHIVGASTNIVNAQGVMAGLTNLTVAEITAASAVGGIGVAYFTFGGNEYLVAAHALEAGLSVGDAVVALHGVSITGLSMAAGVVHLV